MDVSWGLIPHELPKVALNPQFDDLRNLRLSPTNCECS